MTYKTATTLAATRITDDKKVHIQLTDIHFLSYGTFSNVYKGFLHIPSASPPNTEVRDVVIKKTWSGLNECTSNDEIRILKLLGRLNHKNIVRLLYTFRNEFSDCVCFSLVFEFLELNLYQYLKSHKCKLPLVETKLFSWQLFRGLFHLQRANICHRDIKPQNLLVNPETGLLKIGDFGASTVDPEKVSQPSYHVTRYYRPPELLLGSTHYGVEIDIWSAGCVFGEMLRGNVLFIGSNSNDQMHAIMSVIGLPTHDDLKAMRLTSRSKWKETKGSYQTNRIRPSSWTKAMPVSSRSPNESIELLKKILVYNPNKRLHGTDLLLHEFFAEIFQPNTLRSSGAGIRCINLQDLEEVKAGDKSMTASASLEDLYT